MMSTTSVELSAASKIEISFATMQKSMQGRRMLTVGDNGSGAATVSQKKSKGKWRCASPCPVLLEMAHSQSQGDELLIVPQQTETPRAEPRPLDETPQPSSSPQPVRTKLGVENDRLSVYGVLRAVEDKDEIDIVVERPDGTNKDLSCKHVAICYVKCILTIAPHRSIQLLYLG